MFQQKPSDDRLAFGDIVAAEWLFDIYLRTDSRALARHNFRDGKTGFIIRPEPTRQGDDAILAQATMDPSDAVFGYGSRRAAIVLTDDCELATLAGERRDGGWGPRGRLLLGSIRPATAEELAHQKERRLDLGRHPLDPDTGSGFEGGIVDFNRVFSVQAKAMAEQRDRYDRIVGLDRDGQIQLAMRWAAHATRHGPLVAEASVLKLAQLLSADGDQERLDALRAAGEPGEDDAAKIATATLATLTAAWWLEGPWLDDVDQAVEDGDRAAPHRQRLVDSMTTIRSAADRTLAALGEASWAPAPE
jgi:hypothetical protein